MKSLNESLFENLSVTELEERLEMTALNLAMAADGGGSHSCSSIDCMQHSITREDQSAITQAVESGQITAAQAQGYLSTSQVSASAQQYLVK